MAHRAYRKTLRAAVILALVAATLPTTTAAPAAAAPAAAPGALWDELSPGTAVVTTGVGLLHALEDGVGDIILSDSVALLAADWDQFELPIQVAENWTVLVRSADDSGLAVRPRTIDWGGALGLVEVAPGATLAFDNIISAFPGNFTMGEEVMTLKNNGSFVWPTVVLLPNSTILFTDSTLYNDDPRCSAQTVQTAMERLARIFPGSSWAGGKKAFYKSLPYRAPVFDMRFDHTVGNATYTLSNVETECFNSLKGERFPTDDSSNSNSSGSSSSGGDDGGGTPAWVWAVVGSVLGCAALAAVGAAFVWRRRRRAASAATVAASAAGQDKLAASEEGLGPTPFGSHLAPAKSGSNSDLPSFQSGSALAPWASPGASLEGAKGLAGGKSESGELQSHFLRTRFGPIDGVQLGELLGRGSYGRVYKGRWRGAIVAVKVVEHRVQPGQQCDLSREPLLSMSVSHPNVVQTHKMCIVKLSDSSSGLERELQAAVAGGAGGSGSSGSGQRVSAFDGSGSAVEVVSPHDVLQPGHYETWLITEYCDRASLHDLLRGVGGARWAPDPGQRDLWTLLALLDIAQGLDYLHSNTIIHGDLKPANVLQKSARNDRRGFTCKLGDFGLSRMLSQDESHIETQSYGTASYAAPELLLEGKLSAAADIYSLGIIMWEVVSAGTHLYQGMSAMQIILQVSQFRMRPELPEGCPPALADLMQRCWAQDPAERPTAVQVVEELRAQLTTRLRAMPAGSGGPPSRAGSGAALSSGAAPSSPPLPESAVASPALPDSVAPSAPAADAPA